MKHALLLVIISLLLSGALFAQPSLPGGPSQAPLDGGLLALLAGGLWYGFHKLTDRDEHKKGV